MTGKNDAYSYSTHPNHTVWTSSKVFLLHPFSSCLNSFLASFVGDALHFQTVASTPKHAFSTPQWRETARGFSGGNNGWPRADPRITGWTEDLRILVPENVGTSPMEASTSTIPKHMVLRILKRKEINESKSQQKGQKYSFGEDLAELFLNLKCHKNVSSTSFWPPCGFSKVYNRYITIRGVECHRLVLL